MSSQVTTPIRSPEDGAREAELQRAALRSLVELVTSSAEEEAQLERRRRVAIEKADAELTRVREAVESHHRTQLEALDTEYASRIAQIDEQVNEKLKGLQASEWQAQNKLKNELELIQREQKQKLQQATWLADSVLEAEQERLETELREAKEAITAHVEHLAALEEHAAGLMYRYGQEWSESGSTAPPEIAPEEATAAFEARLAEVEGWLRTLGGMTLARLFVGVMPFLIVLVVAGVAGVGAQLLSGSREPQWARIGAAAGGAAALLVVVGFFVRRATQERVARVGRSLRAALDAARLAARRELDFANQRYERGRLAAQTKRDSEVQAARAKVEPVLARAMEAYNAGMAAVEEEKQRLLPKIEGQGGKVRAETDAWRAETLSQLESHRAARLAEAQQRRDAEFAAAEEAYRSGRAALEKRWHEQIAAIQSPIAGGGVDGSHLLDFEAASLADWTPPSVFPATVPFGRLRVDVRQIVERVPTGLPLPEQFSVPALLAFPTRGSLLIHADQSARLEAVRTLQAVMLRLLTSLPAGRVRFTIIDPVGLGQNFAGFMHLADYDEALVGSRIWTDREHIETRLADLTEHMETVIQKYLRNEFATIDDYNAQAGELAEPYRFLVISDFPTNFTDDAMARLSSIVTTGGRCGVYVLMMRDTRQPIGNKAVLDNLRAHSVNLVREGDRFVWKDEVFRQFPLELDAPPSEERLTEILHVVGRSARQAKRVEVPFTAIAPRDGEMWSRNSAEDLQAPIGRMGATRLQSMRLGRGVAQHALIAGKTGSGKSTLLHVMVTNLALWYSPQEVEFYLVDFKKGVEFKAYATHQLPHARAIAVESDREFGLSVLQRVDAELTRRGELFRKAGVQDLASYRSLPDAQPMPRTLLIIDEFQEFFSEDDRLAQEAGLLLDRLVRQGRAFGVHVLLGSQTISGASGLARSTLGQMAIRIALQTSEADSQLILGDNNSAARLLSRPGEAIYNDAGGLVEGNSPFQVAWLSDVERERYLAQVREAADRAGVRMPPPIVFEGNVPADIRANELLAGALSQPPSGVPVAPRAWLGEPVAIKEPTSVTFRRQSGANLLIVGQQEELAMALMAASVTSLAAQYPRDGVRFVVLDGSPADSPLAQVLPRLREVIPHAIELVEYRAAGTAIEELAATLQARQDSHDVGPAVYLLVYGLQRYRVLRKSEDAFSFSMGGDEGKPADPGRLFADLLRDGPPVGMHVIGWADTNASMERTLDRGSMREFDHRVLFQMSATDSSNLIDSPAANKLGPNRALAYSEEQGVMEKFRPYGLPDAGWLELVRERLKNR